MAASIDACTIIIMYLDWFQQCIAFSVNLSVVLLRKARSGLARPALNTADQQAKEEKAPIKLTDLHGTYSTPTERATSATSQRQQLQRSRYPSSALKLEDDHLKGSERMHMNETKGLARREPVVITHHSRHGYRYSR